MSDLYIVGVDDTGNAGLTGPFSSETVARIAAEHVMRPRLCRIAWIDPFVGGES